MVISGRSKYLMFKEYFKMPMKCFKKCSTIRKSAKNFNVGDRVVCEFEESGEHICKEILEINKITFKNLSHYDAWCEGYKHVDLLKHELKCIYPDVSDDTVLFKIVFKRW